METTPPPPSPWKSYEKIGFRYALIFFILFIVLLDWSANPIFSYLYYYGHLATALDSIIDWVGKHLFHIPYVIVSPYDGEHNDRTYVYLLYFTMALVAVIGTAIWSVWDRKRPHYKLLYYGLTTIIRYYLAFTIFLFALYKFFKLQFPDPDFYTLTEQVGDMSPMHLAWAFFGYSYGYNVFMGLAESTGLLLLFRRTTTMGAILTMAALANVMAVNYSFDVHAKLYPTALFVMALFLLLRDAKPILRFFFTGQAVSLPAIQAPVFPQKWMQISKAVLKTVVITYFLVSHVTDNMGYKEQEAASLNAKSEYAGIYEVESFVVNGDTLSNPDPERWQELIIGGSMLEAVRFAGDSIAFVSVLVDEKQLIVSGNQTALYAHMQEIYNELGPTDDTYRKMDSLLLARQRVSSFSFSLADSTRLVLRGRIQPDSVSIIAKRKQLKLEDFRLMKRRFHWINEASYFY